MPQRRAPDPEQTGELHLPAARLGPASHGRDADASAGGPRFTSEALFRGRGTVWIEHGDDVYQLRITRQGKLILTK